MACGLGVVAVGPALALWPRGLPRPVTLDPESEQARGVVPIVARYALLPWDPRQPRETLVAPISLRRLAPGNQPRCRPPVPLVHQAV